MNDVTTGGPDATASGPPVTAIEAVPIRHYGRWLSAVLVAAALVYFVLAASKADIKYELVPGFFTFDTILTGLGNTFKIAVAAQVLGIVLGVLFAVMRLSRNPVLSTVSWFYIWFFRGTPVLVQLLFWYNLALVFQFVSIKVPFVDAYLFHQPMNDFMTPFMAALLGLGLNEGAYMAEIVRAGIISVDPGQTEAAHALGMTNSLTMRRIVLPQAMRVIIPPTGNEFISMLKTSSLAALVTYEELTRMAQNIYTRNLLLIELLLTISIWYLALTTVASIVQYFVERRFARGSNDAAGRADFAQVMLKMIAIRRDGSMGA